MFDKCIKEKILTIKNLSQKQLSNIFLKQLFELTCKTKIIEFYKNLEVGINYW